MSSYRKGRRFEYDVMKTLRALGWLTIRSAGSHGIDIVAIKDGMVILIECKSEATEADRRRLDALGEKLGLPVLLVTKAEGPIGEIKGFEDLF